jgi:hypothetical protein
MSDLDRSPAGSVGVRQAYADAAVHVDRRAAGMLLPLRAGFMWERPLAAIGVGGALEDSRGLEAAPTGATLGE